MDNGLLIIDKPIGITSRTVVDQVIKLVKSNKVGHTGSLDPFATGVLIITVNKATKIGPYIENLHKKYQATIKFGVKTDSGDHTGKQIATTPIIDLNEQYVSQVLETFLGSQAQVPPMFSSLKVKGKPLHKYARQGVILPRSSRPYYVYDIKLLDLEKDALTFQATVSKGTYIRTLGEDIAEKMAMVGHLTSLRRIAIGEFDESQAMDINNIDLSKMISIAHSLSFLEKRVIDKGLVKAIKDGVPQSFYSDQHTLLLVDENDEPLAIYQRKDDGRYYSQRGLF
jgi:tRNA pseudouridine55 synthase